MYGYFVKPPYVEMVAEDTMVEVDGVEIMAISLELRTSFMAAPLYVYRGQVKPRPHNFDALENRACDISRDLGVPIVYTEDYLALKNRVIQQEIG